MFKSRPLTFCYLAALIATMGLNIAACVGDPSDETTAENEESELVAEERQMLEFPPLNTQCITIKRGSSSGYVYDAYVDPGAPSTNFGGDGLIRAGGGKRGYIQFDINAGAIPVGATIKSAEAVLYPIEEPGSGTLDVHEVTGIWSEYTSLWFAGISYNGQPTFNSTPLRSFTYSGKNTVRIDLTQRTIAAVQSGANYYGLMLEGEGNFNVASSEYTSSTYAPYLYICYFPSPCEGVADGTTCQQAEQCRVNGTCQSGVCVGGSPQPAGTVCRSSGGECDPDEVCNGSSFGCPTQVLAPTTTVCRAASGGCDAQETCNGASRACPANLVKPAGTVCRSASDVCDVAETCSGTSYDCPGDVVKSAGTVCRAASDACDAAETCNGSSKSCPSDAVQPAGTVCRSAASSCDIAESCTGSSKSCPSNNTQPNGAQLCGSSNLACYNGNCLTCGGVLQPCCGNSCNLGAFCHTNATCYQCGGGGQQCCPSGAAADQYGGSCVYGYTCNLNTNTCIDVP